MARAGTYLSWSRPRSSCRYTIWVSASGSRGSLQSPRVTAKCVRLQPAAEGQSVTSNPSHSPPGSPSGRLSRSPASASQIALQTYYVLQAPLPSPHPT